ncbi:MAG: type I methionyl aminopeptidase [Clostridia bacterium]|nr:type I methionyl aminopeptidase [Deltaproteobacteria bacterium]
MNQRKRSGIVLKSPREIDLMRAANQHVAEVLETMRLAVTPGVSTWDLDQIARAEIKKRGVKSAFLGYHGFPATICSSRNEVVVHGIPSKKVVLAEGDIISLDIGLFYEGYCGDAARTLPVGKISEEAQRLIRVTTECLEKAIAVCTPDHRLSDIGKAVQAHAEENGYSVVREFVGHGIGTEMHQGPQVPNYYSGPKPLLVAGMTIAIEPMVNQGAKEVEVLKDGWTAVTGDRKLSCHVEHSVAITDGEPIVLSRLYH